jgi:hypothetical protein
MSSAPDTLQAELAEQEAAGWDHDDRALVDCPTCGEAAVLVSERTSGAAGPLLLDGYTVHVDAGDAYYHTAD